MYKQHHLCSSKSFLCAKLIPGTVTSGRIKNNFKGTTKRFIAKDYAFSFMGLFKGAPATGNTFI